MNFVFMRTNISAGISPVMIYGLDLCAVYSTFYSLEVLNFIKSCMRCECAPLSLVLHNLKWHLSDTCNRKHVLPSELSG